jgi:hypothetical protein
MYASVGEMRFEQEVTERTEEFESPQETRKGTRIFVGVDFPFRVFLVAKTNCESLCYLCFLLFSD